MNFNFLVMVDINMVLSENTSHGICKFCRGVISDIFPGKLWNFGFIRVSH